MDDVQARIAELVKTQPVVLFMKGTRRQPSCGFSAKVVSHLDKLLPAYETVDVLADAAVRDGIKGFTGWPTIPQLFIKGEFVGGCDIVEELARKGELAKLLEGVVIDPRTVTSAAAPAKVSLLAPRKGAVSAPKVTVTAAAARVIAGHEKDAPGERLHLERTPDGDFDLYLAPVADDAFAVEAGHGLTVFVPRASAALVDGVQVDFDEQGQGFRLTGGSAPAAATPAQVMPLSATDFKAMRDRDDKHVLFDVRTEAERALAVIAGARHYDEAGKRFLESLPRDTTLVFQCHHGVRSRGAAEQALRAGFSRVYNLTGGIDAWSLNVDPQVPRY
jgi:monothiol glutaredoxin